MTATRTLMERIFNIELIWNIAVAVTGDTEFGKMAGGISKNLLQKTVFPMHQQQSCEMPTI